MAFRVLLTGNGPTHAALYVDRSRTFAGDSEAAEIEKAILVPNPSWLTVAPLNDATLTAAPDHEGLADTDDSSRPLQLIAKELSLADTYAWALEGGMAALHDEDDYDAIVHVGTSFGRGEIAVERLAYRYGYTKRDIHHHLPPKQGHLQGFVSDDWDITPERSDDEALEPIVDAEEMVDRIRRAGYQHVAVSTNSCASWTSISLTIDRQREQRSSSVNGISTHRSHPPLKMRARPASP